MSRIPGSWGHQRFRYSSRAELAPLAWCREAGLVLSGVSLLPKGSAGDSRSLE